MFNKLLEDERWKQQVKPVIAPQELKPFVFPRHTKERSHVVEI